MTVATQQERALGAGRAAQLLAAAPNVIGVHWFQYADEPTGGRADGEDYNFGLVDIDDRPYGKLIRALRGEQPPGALGHGSAYRAPNPERIGTSSCRGPTSSRRRRRLADWPKAASLVPMIASSSEVPFGDVHLAWDDLGLFLATIAMDYYAPELLGPLAEFPRSEAFRIALGVEAGGGPRRIELRVVPHRVSADRPEGNQIELRRAGLPVPGRAMIAPPSPARPRAISGRRSTSRA